MTGKVYYIEETKILENGEEYIVRYDKPEHWYYIKSSCDKIISDMDMQDFATCYEKCFCELYRIKIKKSIKQRNYRKAFKLWRYGFIRMIKDKLNKRNK